MCIYVRMRCRTLCWAITYKYARTNTTNISSSSHLFAFFCLFSCLSSLLIPYYLTFIIYFSYYMAIICYAFLSALFLGFVMRGADLMMPGLATLSGRHAKLHCSACCPTTCYRSFFFIHSFIHSLNLHPF